MIRLNVKNVGYKQNKCFRLIKVYLHDWQIMQKFSVNNR